MVLLSETLWTPPDSCVELRRRIVLRGLGESAVVELCADHLKFLAYVGNLFLYQALALLRGFLCAVDVLGHQALADAKAAAHGRGVQLGMGEEDAGDANRLGVVVLEALE